MNIPDYLSPDEVPPVFDTESADWTLPNGETISGWVSGHNTSRKWIYIWFDADDVPDVQPGSAQYRVFPFGQPDGQWQPLSGGDPLYRRTADDPEPGGAEDAQLGARFKLPVGHYSFEFRITYGGKRIELRGGNFHVFRNEREILAYSDEQIRLFRSRTA